MRRQWSDDPFLLAQLDDNFDAVYDRLRRSTVAFINEWSRTEKKLTIDKNRGWLFNLELLRHIQPDFKMIVCLRDLRFVFASIEKQHRKTMLLDFPDKMEPNVVDSRADALFADGGVIGSPVKALYNVGDIPDISKHIFYLRYEDVLADPQKALATLLKWVGLDDYKFDLNNIKQVTHESDSYHRFKYPHKVAPKFEPPQTSLENVSPRILSTILTKFAWYYESFYPELKQEPRVATETRIQDELAEVLGEVIEKPKKAVPKKRKK